MELDFSVLSNPLKVVFFVFLGGAITITITFFDYPYSLFVSNYTYFKSSNQFIHTNEFRLWLMIVTAQIVVSVIVFMPLWKSLRSLSPELKTRKNASHWMEVGLVLILLVYGLFIATRSISPACDYPINFHGIKGLALSAIAYTVALMCGTGILLTNLTLRNTFNTNELKQERIPSSNEHQARKLISEYLCLRRYLIHLLSLTGIMLVLATLTVGAKRLAMVAPVLDPPIICNPSFTPKRVVVYGFFLTALLAVVYIPTYSMLLTSGRRLRDELLPDMPSVADDSWSSWYSKREELEDLLKVNLSVAEGLKAGATMLAPLAASLISLSTLVNKLLML